MVFGIPLLFLFIPGEHGEIHDPGKRHHVRVRQVQLVPEDHPQTAQHLVDDRALVRGEQDEVAGTRPGPGLDGFRFFRLDEFRGGAL